eukprot:363474-Chlamydomonas_euryale.AAC.8
MRAASPLPNSPQSSVRGRCAVIPARQFAPLFSHGLRSGRSRLSNPRKVLHTHASRRTSTPTAEHRGCGRSPNTGAFLPAAMARCRDTASSLPPPKDDFFAAPASRRLGRRATGDSAAGTVRALILDPR